MGRTSPSTNASDTPNTSVSARSCIHTTCSHTYIHCSTNLRSLIAYCSSESCCSSSARSHTCTCSSSLHSTNCSANSATCSTYLTSTTCCRYNDLPSLSDSRNCPRSCSCSSTSCYHCSPRHNYYTTQGPSYKEEPVAESKGHAWILKHSDLELNSVNLI